MRRTIDEFPWRGDFACLEVFADGNCRECASTSPYGNGTATQTWTEVEDVTVRIESADIGPDCRRATKEEIAELQVALDAWLLSDDGESTMTAINEHLLGL